jgi:hypothetical protein
MSSTPATVFNELIANRKRRLRRLNLSASQGKFREDINRKK